MKKIFLDTNILLDVILKRRFYLQNSILVWSDCERKIIDGYVSAISLNNIHYILRKYVSSPRTLEYLKCILNIFKIVPLDSTILYQAIDSPERDFEDTIQILSALQIKADCILTRDIEHFKTQRIPIVVPANYIKWRCG